MNTLVNKKHGWGYFPNTKSTNKIQLVFHTLYLFFFAMNFSFVNFKHHFVVMFAGFT